jgi:hypothetical protein
LQFPMAGEIQNGLRTLRGAALRDSGEITIKASEKLRFCHSERSEESLFSLV